MFCSNKVKVLDEGETLMDGSPLLTPVWQELGNAPERRGLGAAPAAYPQSASGSAAGAGGGGHRSLRRSVAAGPPVLARGPPVLARGPPVLARGPPVLAREQSQIARTPLIRRQMQIPGTPVLAEDPRQRNRNRTRKIKH